MRSRDDLLHGLVETFRWRPEVRSIHEFGRAVGGKVDEYSDLDIVVCSNDPAHTQRDCLGLLGQIAPVLGVYYIRCEPTGLALMAMLEGFSPYQKIDLGVVPTLETMTDFGPFNCLYDSGRAAAGTGTTMTFAGERESLANRLSDLLFSIPRFTKCLFRGDWDMYRRWTGMVEAMAMLLHESYFGWRHDHAYRLKPQEYKALHAALSPAHRVILNEIQPLDGRPDLPTGFARAVDLVVELYSQKAKALGERLDLALASRLCGFMRDEIKRALEQR